MADKYEGTDKEYQGEVISSLQNIDTSVKTFGPKMPAGDLTQKEQEALKDHQILDFTDVICGALAAFFYGKQYSPNKGITNLVLGAKTQFKLIDQINNISSSVSTKSKSENSIPNLLKSINSNIANLVNPSNNGSNGALDINISGVKNEESIKHLADLVGKIENVKIDDFNAKTKKIVDTLKEFESLNDDKLAVAGAKSADMYVKMAESFVKLSQKLGDIDVKAIERCSRAMKDIGIITLVLTGTLILVGFVGGSLDYIGIVKFILALAFFTGSLLLIFNKKLTKGLAEANEGLKGLSLLVTVCGALLIGASLISDFIKFESLVSFISNLTGFVGGLLLVFKLLPTSGMKQTLKGAEDVALLVLVCGGVLLFGSLVSKLIDPVGLLVFSGSLILLMMSLAIPLLAFRKIAPGALKGVAELAILVGVCGMVLLFGGTFLTLFPQVIPGIIKFAGILLLFTLLITGYSALMHWLFKPAWIGIGEFATLVGMCGIILLFGGTFLTLFPGVIPGMIKFAFVLALGIALIVLPLNLLRTQIRMAVKTALALSILIGVIAVVLLIGAYLVNSGKKIVSALIFAGIVSLFIGMISGIMIALSLLKDKLVGGIIGFVTIALVVGIFAIIFYSIIKMKLAEKQEEVWLFLGVTSAFIVSMGLLAAAASYAIGHIIVGLIGIVLIGVMVYALIDIMKFITRENKNIVFNELFGDSSAIKEVISNGEFNQEGGMKVIGALSKGFIGKAFAFLLGMGAISVMLSVLAAPIIAGTVVIGLISTSVAMLSGAMMLAVKASTELNKMSNINTDNIAKAIKGFADISLIFISSFSSPLITLRLPLTIANITGICTTLGIMAIAIQQIASLKIPIYSPHSTEIQGYRSLDTQDFQKASKNVESIVTILGGAIINAYEKNPTIFETNWFGNSPFGKVTRAMKNLGPLIEKLAVAIKEYAELKIPIYEGTKKVGYEHLTENHFKDAAHNVSLIITTLGQTIIDTYNNNSEMFDGNTWFTSSPFMKVVNQTSKLGSLISTIAEAIQDYAEMKVPYTDSNGVIIKDKYRVLKEQDFTDASNNVSLIITTLGKSIIRTYYANEDMFDGNTWFTDSPFMKVVKQTSKLGSLISTIAESIKDYAEMKVPYIDENGAIVKDKFRVLNDDDFTNASNNIGRIIKLLVDSLIQTYGDGSKFNLKFGESGNFVTNVLNGVSTFFSGDSPLEKVINHAMLLGPLMSSLAKGVQDFADLRIPEYDANGKITGYRAMTDTDFTLAKENISKIISLMSDTLAAKANDPAFESGLLSDSPLQKVLSCTKDIGDVISSIASGIKSYAELKIPTYGADGKPNGYSSISSQDFIDASENIGKVVNILASTFIKIANGEIGIDINGNPISNSKEQRDLYKKIWAGESDVIENVIEVSTKIGDTISNISKGIQSYANLNIPIYDPSTGKVIGYNTLKNDTFITASQNIGKVIGTIVTTMIKISEGYYIDENSNWSSNVDATYKTIWSNIDDSPIVKMIDPINKMGNMISNIAKALQSYANLSIPETFDNKGNIIKSRPFTGTDFSNASKNIATIITSIGLTLYGLYSGNFKNLNSLLKSAGGKEIDLGADTISDITSFWEYKEGAQDHPINRVLDASIRMSEVITSIAQAVQGYASLNIPVHWDKDGKPDKFEPLNKKGNIFTEAANNISGVILAIGTGIMGAYNQQKEWFDPVKLQKIERSMWGSTTITETEGNTPMYNAILAAAKMGDIVSNIATGVLKFANGRIFEYNDKGEKTGNTIELKNYKIDEAKGKITEILKAIAEAVYSTYNTYKPFFDDKNINTIMTAMLTMSKAVSGIAGNIKDFAQMKIQKYDENGKAIKNEFIILDKDKILDAGETIKTVMNTLVTAFNEYGDSLLSNDDATKNITQIATNTDNFVDNVESIVNSINKLNEILDKLDEINVSTIQNKINLLDSILFGETLTTREIGGTKFIRSKLLETRAGGIIEIIKNLTSQIESINSGQKITLNLNEISSGIGAFIDAINKIKTSKNIQDWANKTGEFVKHIKSADPDKLGKLKDIATSLAALAKAESDNKFITATENFVQSIDDLTNALEKEEKITKNRKKLIEDNVKQIRTLMNQEMKVVLSTDATSTTTSGGSTTQQSGGSTSTTSSPSGGGSSSGGGAGGGVRGESTTTNNDAKKQRRSSIGGVATSNNDIDSLCTEIHKLVDILTKIYDKQT